MKNRPFFMAGVSSDRINSGRLHEKPEKYQTDLIFLALMLLYGRFQKKESLGFNFRGVLNYGEECLVG